MLPDDPPNSIQTVSHHSFDIQMLCEMWFHALDLSSGLVLVIIMYLVLL